MTGKEPLSLEYFCYVPGYYDYYLQHRNDEVPELEDSDHFDALL